MTTLYTFDDDTDNHNINTAGNYFNEDTQTRSNVVPGSEDAVESGATTEFFGSLTLYRWQFGTLAAGGQITADFADDMVIKGHLTVDDAASLTARGSLGRIDADHFSGGNLHAEDGASIAITNDIHRTGNDIGVFADGGTITVGGDITGAGVGSVTANNSGSIDVESDISTANIGASNDSTIEAQNLSVVERSTVGIFSGATLTVLGNMAWTAASLNSVITSQGGFDIRDGGKLSVGSALTLGGAAGVYHDGLLLGTGAKLEFVGTMISATPDAAKFELPMAPIRPGTPLSSAARAAARVI